MMGENANRRARRHIRANLSFRRIQLCGGVFLSLLTLASAEAQQMALSASPATRVSTDPLGRDNPQSAVIGFLQTCHSQNYKQATAYLDLHRLTATQRVVEGPKLARQLEQLLDSNQEFAAGSLSRNPAGNSGTGSPEAVATFLDEGRKTNLELDRVQVGPDSAVWLFSSSSIGLLPQLSKLIGESAFEKRLPRPLVDWTFLDTPLWRWFALVLLAVLLTALSSLLLRVLLVLAHPILRRLAAYLHTAFLEALAGPLRLLVAVSGFRAGMEFIEPSALLRYYLGRILVFLFAIGVTWAAMRLIDVSTDRIRFVLAAEHADLSSSMLPLVNKMIKIIIFVLMISAILGNWGYNTTTVLAGVGVGGLAVALAAQKTLENLFGGIAVISDRPVLVGDLCRFGERTGRVEEIGLRSTRRRTLDRSLVTVPNGQFSSMPLENLSQRDKIWFHPRISLVRETSPAQIRQLIGSISRLLASNSRVDIAGRSVWFAAVGAYSLDLDVSAYILTSDDDEFSRVQQELLLRLLETVEGAGACLAVPTQKSINYDVDARVLPQLAVVPKVKGPA
jgi:MscS family membrane protein